MRHDLLLASGIMVAILTLGCGNGGRTAVSGLVTIDGQPLQAGSITFIPVEGNRGPTAGGVIEDGYYEINSRGGPVLGKNRVEIRGSILTGRQLPDPRMPNMKLDETLAIPKRYNTNSSLVRDLAPGNNNLDFELHSK